jgi:Tol biopolymer transport system component
VAWLQTPVVHALPRALAPDDYYQLLDVSDPQLSPDGSMIAYVVTRNDRTADAAKSAVWMVDWDGKERRPLTQDGASQPRFSPDGRYLSFLAARPTDAPAQLWLLDLHGGEARQVTHAGGEIASYAWAPDGSRLVLVMSKGEADAAKSPQPIVIDDYHFKQDEEGYLSVGARKHLYLIDVASGVQTALTTAADFDDDDAAWAPDGKLLAYVSNHAKEAQRSGIDEIYLLEPRAGAVPRKLAAAFSPNHQHLAFSPDGRFVSFLQGREPRLNAYMDDRLAVVAVATGAVRPLTDPLDQQVSAPAFSADGASIDFIVEDHGAARETRAVLASGKISQVSPDRITVLGQSLAAGHTVILGTTDSQPPELFALEAG